uniref:BPTI/Kunitz inhibitor domain-containing protein n=1 Tax=Heliothis virescens TaxID=7102 RepID=A0A2A4K6K6_HELVI
MFIVTVCFSFVLNWNTVLSCWSDGSYYQWHQQAATQFPHAALVSGAVPPLNLSQEKKHINRLIISAWNGWTPPPQVQKEWKEWREAFKNKTKMENSDWANDDNRDRLQQERGPNSGWPKADGWQGLGEGRGGVPIPPWAYTPKESGKPMACMQGPRKGTCKKKENVWGYNPYTDACETYLYSGCGGSKNNFKTKLLCEQFCTLPDPPTCGDDSGIVKDYSNIYDP